MIEDRLRGAALRELPARRIVAAIAGAAHRWTGTDFSPRVRSIAAIAERTGYSTPAVEYALDQLFTPITCDALCSTIESEIGSLAALDGFVARAGRPDAFACGVDRACIISSRTTIGVGLIPAIYALCAKSDVTVKDREDHLIAAFFQTLHAEDEAFMQAARAQTFSSTDDALPDLAAFGCVVAFGTNATLAEIRAACDPNARFVGFGARASAGYLSVAAARDARTRRSMLEGAARDVVLYDSEGCLSLHVLFIESEGAAREIVADLATAVRSAGAQFPVGADDGLRASRVSTVRNAAAFRAALGQGAVFADDAGTFAIVCDPPHDEPPPFAPRCIAVVPVREPSDAAAYLRRHHVDLEAFAISDGRPDIVTMALGAGAVRLTRFGELQRPPPGGNHGGRGRIVDFIRWIEREI